LGGARFGPAALKRRYKLRRDPDKSILLRRLINKITTRRVFYRKFESEAPGCCISKTKGDTIMNANSTGSETFESTYALIVRSEEKQRSRFETLVYTVLAVSTICAVFQFGRQATMMPSSIVRVSTTVSAPAQHGA
jgi:hypothetical protein